MATKSSNLDAVSVAGSEFSQKFFKALSDEGGNLVCSPLSMHLALAMVHAGAKGQTAEKLAKALFLPMSDVEEAHQGFKELVTNLNSLEKVELAIANKMYVKKAFPIEPPYSAALGKYFDASAENVDFLDEATADIINKWVAQKTKNKINKIFSADDFDLLTRVVLVNAVYFNGLWLKQFYRENTRLGNFFTDKRQEVKVEFMHRWDHISYARLDELDAQIVELPYKGGDLSFVVVLPTNRSGLADLEEKLASCQLSELLRRTEKTNIKLFLPKFKVESTLDLKQLLASKFGLEQIFDKKAADFSGISTAPELKLEPLRVSGVIQKVFIEVNEEGTEAAAVTRISLRGGAIMPEVPKVECDRPFAFFVVYKRQLAVFSGRLVRPACGV